MAYTMPQMQLYMKYARAHKPELTPLVSQVLPPLKHVWTCLAEHAPKVVRET